MEASILGDGGTSSVPGVEVGVWGAAPHLEILIKVTLFYQLEFCCKRTFRHKL